MKRRACARISPDHRGPLSHANGCSRIHNLSSKHGNASKKLVQTSLLSFFGKREASSFNVVEEVVGGKSVEVICLEDSARKPLLVPVEWEKQIVTHSEFKVENNSKITTKNTRGPMNNKRTKWRKPDLPARKVYHSRMMSTTYLPCIQKYLPEFKKIQDSTFTVDCFSYGAIPGVTHYFLRLVHLLQI